MKGAHARWFGRTRANVRPAQGFTLLEVVIALAILSLSLIVLLQVQGQSLASAGRSRDLTVATFLARSKMVDLEQKLFHEGFVSGTQEDSGDFAEEDHAEITWKTKVSEVDFDLSLLAGLCGTIAAQKGGSPQKNKKSSGDEDPVSQCETMLGSLGSVVGSFTAEIGRSIRVTELIVTWPVGPFKESLSLRALLTQDDFNTLQQSETMRVQDQLQGSGLLPPAQGGQGQQMPQAGGP